MTSAGDAAGDSPVEKCRLESRLRAWHIVTMLIDEVATIGILVHDVARSIRYAFDARARNLGVTRQQWRVLMYLARRDGSTQTELADALDVERITIGRMVDRLVESGLIERREDPQDRRVWRLHLLPSAHGLVGQLTEVAAGLEREVLASLTPHQREELGLLLGTVRETIKGLRPEPGSPRKVA